MGRLLYKIKDCYEYREGPAQIFLVVMTMWLTAN